MTSCIYVNSHCILRRFYNTHKYVPEPVTVSSLGATLEILEPLDDESPFLIALLVILGAEAATLCDSSLLLETPSTLLDADAQVLCDAFLLMAVETALNVLVVAAVVLGDSSIITELPLCSAAFTF